MWTLFEKQDGKWVLVDEKKSGDACKTEAMRRNRTESRSNLGKEFLIVNPVGNNWMKSVNTGSWRMKWVYAESGANP